MYFGTGRPSAVKVKGAIRHLPPPLPLKSVWSAQKLLTIGKSISKMVLGNKLVLKKNDSPANGFQAVDVRIDVFMWRYVDVSAAALYALGQPEHRDFHHDSCM